MSVTIFQLAQHILKREPRTDQDFEEAKLPMIGGCLECGATIAAFNAHPTKTGYLMGSCCVTKDVGYDTVQEAQNALFDE